VRPDLSVLDSHAIELRVRDLIRGKIRSIKEVQIHVHANGEEDQGSDSGTCL
jgi:divalent metal cation (Fe/Co/Zn/Cd) transporter